MQVNFLNTQALNFKGYFDDTEGGSLLDMLDRRERANSVELGKEAATQQKTLSKLFSKIKIQNDSLNDSNIAALKQVGHNNNYTGSMRDAANNISELNRGGIKHVISLCRPEESGIEQACKKNGLDFTYFHVPEIQDISKTEKGRKELISGMKGSFAKVVETLRKGDCILGCESGNQRTGIMCGILSMLDPKTPWKVSTEDIPESCEIFGSVIEQTMSKADKKALGYTKEFTEKLAKLLKNYY